MRLRVDQLAGVSIDEIVACLNNAFENYFVSMPKDVNFWQNRFKQNGVDFNLSWGVFDDDKLVAFVVNGIGQLNGVKTAYNSGTGVLESYRGRRLVDEMYEFGLPLLKKQGITNCTLEVITENHRGIAVYERLGYRRQRLLHSFQGSPAQQEGFVLNLIDLSTLDLVKQDEHYVWDQQSFVVQRLENCVAYEILDQNHSVGYVVMNQSSGKLIRMELKNENWEAFFGAISRHLTTVRLSNVDGNRKGLLRYLDKSGFTNTVNQYEMVLKC